MHQSSTSTKKPISKPQENFNKFTEGVKNIFSKWTALSLAVDNDWGGRNDGNKKVSQLLNEVMEMFTQKNTPFVDEVADYLDKFLNDNFNLSIEDDSSDEVAQFIIKLYEECSSGDFSLYNKVIAQPKKQQQNIDAGVVAPKVVPEDDSNSDDGKESDGSEEMEVDKDDSNNNNTTINNNETTTKNSATNQKKEKEPESNNQNQIEDGGWEKVSYKRHGGRK